MGYNTLITFRSKKRGQKMNKIYKKRKKMEERESWIVKHISIR